RPSSPPLLPLFPYTTLFRSTVARRAGLLHDIGKSMDHEQEGGHPQIGMEFLRKFNESEAVLNACLAHHGDVPATTPYTPLIMAADRKSTRLNSSHDQISYAV